MKRPDTVPNPPDRSALPDLAALAAFVAVCEAGSMTLAARRLGLSQSAVSQAIQGLERAQGVALFDRESRPARPTRAGQALLEPSRELLRQARGLAEQWRSLARQDYAQIRLGCVDSFAAVVGPALIRALAGSARELQLWSGLTPALNAQLQARELDLAVCTEAPEYGARLSRRLLCAESWVLVLPRAADTAAVTPSSRPAELEPATLTRMQARIGSLPLIRYSQRSVIGQQVECLLRHWGWQAPRRFEFDATDPLLSLVASGLGWAISTPLCLGQSRAWLDRVDVLPLPPTPLGRREFFLLGHAGEAAGLADELWRVARQVLQHDTLPALRRAMPTLADDAIVLPPPVPPGPPGSPD